MVWADDGQTAYHKVHQILKANTCSRGFYHASWKYAKNIPPLIKACIISNCFSLASKPHSMEAKDNYKPVRPYWAVHYVPRIQLKLNTAI